MTVDCPAAAEAVLSITAMIAATTHMTSLLSTAGGDDSAGSNKSDSGLLLLRSCSAPQL